MSKLTIHNWDKWQSYRSDRGQPPWIKIHRECMRHIEWVSLSDAQRGQLVAIWLLAADHNGVIPASPSIIKKLCHLDTEPNLNMFIEHGFIDPPQDGVTVASKWRQVDPPETETETETEKRKKRKEAEKEVAAFALPDWIDKDTWELWLKTRKGKKMIPEQMQAQVDKLAKWRDTGLDHAKALSDAATNGWQGLFEPKSSAQIVKIETSNDQAREGARARLFGGGNASE